MDPDRKILLFMGLNNEAVGLISRTFANGRGDSGSNLGRLIPRTKKIVLDATLLNSQHYKGRTNWSNPGAPYPTPPFRSYRRRRLRVALGNFSFTYNSLLIVVPDDDNIEEKPTERLELSISSLLDWHSNQKSYGAKVF